MNKEKNPKSMTTLALKMERVRLSRSINNLNAVVDQPSVASQITELKKRRELLKTELLHRHLDREATQSAEAAVASKSDEESQVQHFMTADGCQYRP